MIWGRSLRKDVLRIGISCMEIKGVVAIRMRCKIITEALRSYKEWKDLIKNPIRTSQLNQKSPDRYGDF